MTITTRNGGAYYDDDATEPSALDRLDPDFRTPPPYPMPYPTSVEEDA